MPPVVALPLFTLRDVGGGTRTLIRNGAYQQLLADRRHPERFEVVVRTRP